MLIKAVKCVGELVQECAHCLDTAVSIEAIEVYIHRLRKKLEGSGAEIRTLRGLGYMLEARDA